MRWLASSGRADPNDAEILEQIHAELANVVWVPRDGLSITVKNGVVDLNGVVLEERERERSASSPKMSRASKPSRITSSGSNPSPGSSSIPGRTSGAHPKPAKPEPNRIR